jgi:hypothetical protein
MRCARAASARWCAIQRAKSSAGVAMLRRLRRVRQTLRHDSATHDSVRQLNMSQLMHPSPRGTPPNGCVKMTAS